MASVSQQKRNVEVNFSSASCWSYEEPRVAFKLKNDNQTQQQNIKQIEALLFDALQSLPRVTSCYQLNNARA